ncbi:helix-turn-helix domain-containing protein [Chryseobacterium oranimense]|uniref:helix-turn-helix domain-containing protein n=1 Tax=Chryseobacterium oranimense TaxID=421058 RepID=UPI002235E059|nr:helix-turn-helix domain-containing protein [Chryseobacterium oranimense]
MRPNYTKIYQDIIFDRFPEKITDPQITKLISDLKTAEDVIVFNEILFEKEENSSENQQLRSYDKKTIEKILKYQKKYNLSNSHISLEYKVSRNTIAKWKKIFVI